MARDAVGDVDDPRVGRDPGHDAVADADEVVVVAVVGEEGDDRRHGARVYSSGAGGSARGWHRACARPRGRVAHRAWPTFDDNADGDVPSGLPPDQPEEEPLGVAGAGARGRGRARARPRRDARDPHRGRPARGRLSAARTVATGAFDFADRAPYRRSHGRAALRDGRPDPDLRALRPARHALRRRVAPVLRREAGLRRPPELVPDRARSGSSSDDGDDDAPDDGEPQAASPRAAAAPAPHGAVSPPLGARPRRRAARRRARRACGRPPRRRARSPARAAPRSSPGPIDTSRGPSSVPAAAWKKRADEADVKVATSAPSAAARARSSSGSATVRYSASTSTSRAALAQRVGQHVAGLLGAGDERAADAAARERLDQPLGDRARGHDVGLDPVLAQRARRAGADDGDRRPGQRARVAHPAQQLVGAVGARDAQQVVGRQVGHVGRQRLDADRRRLDHRRAELAQPRGQGAGLRARARDGDVRRRAGARRRRPAPRAARPPAPTSVMAGARTAAAAAAAAISRSGARTVRWSGSVPRSTTAAGSSGSRPAATSCSAMRGKRAHAHVEDERPREGGERRPVDRRLGLGRVLVAGDEGHGAGHPALGDRDPGARRRRDDCPRRLECVAGRRG